MTTRQRRVTVSAMAVLLAACAADSDGPPPPLDEASPGGYEVRLDSERSDPGQFQIEQGRGSARITTGPAGIAWRHRDMVASGDVRIEATFVLHEAPLGYREAYGIFVGGVDLEGPDLEYTYLLIRPSGDVLVKRRRGETTEFLLDWTPHASVRGVEADGDEPVNTVAVEVRGAETDFLVNGNVVHTMPTSEARPYGMAGLRVNHRLDVTLTSWSIGTLATTATPE